MPLLKRRRMMMSYMEGEMDNWETIIDHTTTEDLINFSCDTDINGNSFRLKECVVYLKVLPCEDQGDSVIIRISFNGNHIWQQAISALTNSPKSSEKYSKAFAYFRRIGDAMVPIELLHSYNHSSVPDALTNTAVGYGRFDLDDDLSIKNTVDYIESITVGSYMKVIGKGTRLKVVGVRA